MLQTILQSSPEAPQAVVIEPPFEIGLLALMKIMMEDLIQSLDALETMANFWNWLQNSPGGAFCITGRLITLALYLHCGGSTSNREATSVPGTWWDKATA